MLCGCYFRPDLLINPQTPLRYIIVAASRIKAYDECEIKRVYKTLDFKVKKLELKNQLETGKQKDPSVLFTAVCYLLVV